MEDRELLVELAPHAARLLDRHLASAKEWFPHELVPWDRCQDFDENDWEADASVGDAHHNTGRLLPDVAGRRIMTRVAADENLHHLFYRDLTTAALAIDPETVVPAIERQVRHFAMPGTGIPDFARHARTIAEAGVYDFQVHHDQILIPVLLRHWHLDRLQGLRSTAERARERLLAHVERVGRVARRLVERRIPRVAT